MEPQLAREQSTKNYATLLDALIARLAAEIKFDRSDEALAAAVGVDVAETAALSAPLTVAERQAALRRAGVGEELVEEVGTLGMMLEAVPPPLSAEQERQIDRATWQSVAETCISAMVHVLFDEARGDCSAGPTRFVDEDLERIAAARIAAPFRARHFGLSGSDLNKAAALTVELLRDRTRFVQPTLFNLDGRVYSVQRSDGELLVQACL